MGEGEGSDGGGSSACTLCPDGGMVPDEPPYSFAVLKFNSNDERIACTEVHQLVKGEEVGLFFAMIFREARPVAVAQCQKTRANCVLMTVSHFE